MTYWLTAAYIFIKTDYHFLVYNSAGLLEDLHSDIKDRLTKLDKQATIYYVPKERTPMEKAYGGSALAALWNFYANLRHGINVPANTNK
uniref:APG6 domain-containing protein n=1 Tax=Steinernema glaseri TaxID=37863 RepID=A0A1I8ACV8_9BILA